MKINTSKTKKNELNFEEIIQMTTETLNIECEPKIKNDLESCLIVFYNKCNHFSLKNIECVNKFLISLIDECKKNKNPRSYNLLMIHFEHFPISFINRNLHDNINYLSEVKSFFSSIFNLILHLKPKKEVEVSEESCRILITHIVSFLHSFLINTLKNFESRFYRRFFAKVIIEGQFFRILSHLYVPKEENSERIIHCFFLCSEFEEFDEAIIESGVLGWFVSFISEKQDTHFLMLQILANIVERNRSSIISIINNELNFFYTLLDNIFDNIKKDCYDYDSINLLKLFTCIIESGDCIFLMFLFSSPGNTKNKILSKIKSLVAYFTNIVIGEKEKIKSIEGTHGFGFDFICIFCCLLRNVVELLPSLNTNYLNSYHRNEYNVNKIIKSEHEEELIEEILSLSLHFLIHGRISSEHERNKIESLCFDILLSICHTYPYIIRKFATEESILSKIHFIQNENKKSKTQAYTRTYAQYTQLLFHICFYNESLSKKILKKEFVLQLEKEFYEINKLTQVENVEGREVNNLLKLYLLGMIFTFLRTNTDEESFQYFIKYIIEEELKEKHFLLHNEMYYTLFLKFMYEMILNEMYVFREGMEHNLLENLLKLFLSSNIYFKAMILDILVQWLEDKNTLYEIKKYTKKNKVLFRVLFDFWVELQGASSEKSFGLIKKEELHITKFKLYYILKIHTEDFTKHIKHVVKNEDEFESFKSLMIVESSIKIEIYKYIKDKILSNQVKVLEGATELLNDRIAKLEEKIKKIKKRFDSYIEKKKKKKINVLENYYTCLREQHGIQ